MEYEINNLTKEKIDKNIIEKIIEFTSEYMKIKDAFVSIVLVDNKRIHEINKEYRKVDAPTDVISFAFNDGEEIKSPDLGEIFISLDKVKSQSEEYGHSYERELCFLTVHGILHLLGYDHMNKEDEKCMFDLQEKILEEFGVGR